MRDEVMREMLVFYLWLIRGAIPTPVPLYLSATIGSPKKTIDYKVVTVKSPIPY